MGKNTNNNDQLLTSNQTSIIFDTLLDEIKTLTSGFANIRKRIVLINSLKLNVNKVINNLNALVEQEKATNLSNSISKTK